jgi:hypothetical protein
MPPKRKPTTAGKAGPSATKNKTISKRIGSGRATRPSQRTRSPNRDLSEEQHRSPSILSSNDGPSRLDALELANQAVVDSLDEVKERYEQLQMTLETLTESIRTAGERNQGRSGQQQGMDPTEAVQTNMPWVDKTTLASIMARDLDVAHFIKLVPVEERPRGQSNAGIPTGLLFDAATGKSSMVTESTVNYEKQFPDLPTLVNGLTVYSAIRDIYDPDRQGFGFAITLYIRQLARWSQQHKWTAVISYFIAHFRRYQSSTDPQVWINVDMQYLARFMVPDTIKSQPPPSSLRSPNRRVEACINWNKGNCTWDRCHRSHVCSGCGGSHPLVSCPTRVSSK